MAAARKRAKKTPGSGRKKGSKNKLSLVMKEEILEAYQKRGGVKFLESLDPRDFAALLRQIVPREVSAEIKGSEGLIDAIREGRERARAARTT
jgi:hypothetical protein